MLSVEEARALVLENSPARRIEDRRLEETLGLVVARDISAVESLPAFPRSCMDGYALRAGDVLMATRENPVTMRLAGIIPAGHPLEKPLENGTTGSIMTGGAIPDGADAVIRMEEVRVTEKGILVYRHVEVGENITPIGEDVAQGRVVIRAGHLIRAAEINLMAAIGVTHVPVFAPPRVGILCTGDELAPSNIPPRYGQIRNSNGPGIAALVRAAGCVPVSLGVANDAAGLIAGALSHAVDCDLVLTTGGVSVGDFDVVREALAVLSATQLFWRVAMKPGMPVCAALLEKRLIIGLSGNPAAAITNFDVIVRPLLDFLCGRGRHGLREKRAVLDEPVLKTLPLTRFLRARVYTGNAGELRATTTMSQRAGILSSMIDANAYVIVPRFAGPVLAGQMAAVLLQDDAQN